MRGGDAGILGLWAIPHGNKILEETVPYYGEKKREYDRQRCAARRAAWFVGKVCVICGTTETLELHHINPQTKVSHNVWSWNMERMVLELSKCEVRCSEHHQEVTNVQNKEKFSTPLSEKKHGTNNTYNHHGCRCEDCREWRRSKFIRLGT